MNTYKYTLEAYKSPANRYECPQCGHNKTFSRYIDTENGEHINQNVGRCSRESNCGYHLKPKDYFNANGIVNSKNYCSKSNTTTIYKPISYIEKDALSKSLSHYEANNFIQFIKYRFGTNSIIQTLRNYHIGTSKVWSGATVFWQIDINNNIRTGKIMLYDKITGKRVKTPHNHIDWVHRRIKTIDFELSQCFFGENLLIDASKTVAIVESEKTAVIASLHFPEYTWLATGGLSNLSIQKSKCLQGRNIVLFPDIKGFHKWKIKAEELSSFANVRISDLLERRATESERNDGLDLADYLLKLNIKTNF